MKDDREIRNVIKNFRFSKNEIEKIKCKANKSGMDLSKYIRNRALEYEIREKPDKEFYEVMKQMRSISNNLNQISMKAHTLGFIDVLAYRKEVNKLNTFMLQVKEKYLL